MAGKRTRPKVVLCAALTADGKLDAASPVLPPLLSGGNADPSHHPWAASYGEAAAILVSTEAASGWGPTGPAAKPTIMLNWTLLATSPPDKQRRQLLNTLQGSQVGFPGMVLCLGGASLFRALLGAGLVDELRLIVRPKIDGQRGSASLSGAGGDFFPAAVACRLVGMETVGDECFLHYRVRQLRRAVSKAA